FFFSSRRRHTSSTRDWSSDVCSSDLPFGGTFAKDTFETGTRAAAFGGTTTIIDFAVQSRGKALREGLDAWHAKAEGHAVVDYGFHMIMSDVNDDTLAEMDALVAEGVPDFKLF